MSVYVIRTGRPEFLAGTQEEAAFKSLESTSIKMHLRFSFSMCLLLVASGMLAAGPERPLLEQGVVAPVTAGQVWNCLPNIARLGNGDLLAVWSVSDKVWSLKLQIMASRSTDGGRTWSAGTYLAGQPKNTNCDASLLVDGDRAMLFWSLVRNPNRIEKLETWKMVSADFGHTWSKPEQVPMPRKYAGTQSRTSLTLRDGRLVLPYAWDIWIEQGMVPKTEGEMNLKASLLTSSDHGETWHSGGDVYVEAPKTTPFSTSGACEPGIVELADGSLYMLVRTGTSHAWESRSRDGGKTWTEARPSPLKAHNTNVALRRLQGTADVVAVWNNSPRNRWPLVVALSRDGCQTWSQPHELAGQPGLEASYASLTQLDDGTVVVVWQQDLPKNQTREIRFARFNRAWIAERDEGRGARD